MLIENPSLLIAACTGGAAALSAVMRATSGQMGGALERGNRQTLARSIRVSNQGRRNLSRREAERGDTLAAGKAT